MPRLTKSVDLSPSFSEESPEDLATVLRVLRSSMSVTQCRLAIAAKTDSRMQFLEARAAALTIVISYIESAV